LQNTPLAASLHPQQRHSDMIYAAILISALLYRIPRGGPNGHVWRGWIGFAPGSRVSTSVWALASAGALVYAAVLIVLETLI